MAIGLDNIHSIIVNVDLETVFLLSANLKYYVVHASVYLVDRC